MNDQQILKTIEEKTGRKIKRYKTDDNNCVTGLDMSESQLESLPEEIGQLKALQILYLYQNQLTAIPEEIAQLENLQILHLSENQLTSIPPEIGQLQNLQILYLYRNI